MTDQEKQIEHLKDQIFKLRMTVQGISGTAAANAEWAKDAFQKEGFKKIERRLDEAVAEIKMRP
tara:strand:- start:215 stop:406 length:192 start_codon:yes stop_codon:yes gene_type:complete